MVTPIKIERIKQGMKQKELAAAVGVTDQYIQRIENGIAKNPSIPIMKKIAAALNCSVQELFFSEMG